MHKSNVSEIRHRLCAPASRTSKTFLTRVQPVMGYVGPSAAAAALDAHSLLRVRTFQDGRRIAHLLLSNYPVMTFGTARGKRGRRRNNFILVPKIPTFVHLDRRINSRRSLGMQCVGGNP